MYLLRTLQLMRRIGDHDQLLLLYINVIRARYLFSVLTTFTVHGHGVFIKSRNSALSSYILFD